MFLMGLRNDRLAILEHKIWLLGMTFVLDAAQLQGDGHFHKHCGDVYNTHSDDVYNKQKPELTFHMHSACHILEKK